MKANHKLRNAFSSNLRLSISKNLPSDPTMIEPPVAIEFSFSTAITLIFKNNFFIEHIRRLLLEVA